MIGLFITCLGSLLGCALTQAKTSGPVFARAVQAQLAEPTVAPDAITERFTVTDAFVHAKVVVRNLSDAHTVRWRWLAPTGRVYVESPAYSFGQAGRSYAQASVWHKIRLAGEPAAELPGQWTVEMYLDDQLVATKPFEIQGHPPIGCRRPL
jgi:hypothetical protein